MAKKKTRTPACDRDVPSRKASDALSDGRGALPPLRVMRHRPDYSWSGVRTERYKEDDGTWSDVLRRTIVGGKGERTKFHLRYFEVSPGGRTTLECHRHEHVVVCARGRGRCRVKTKTHEIGFLDTLYIPPDAPHQLLNPFEEPFGFFCLVDAQRDRPRPVPGKGKTGKPRP
jgi:ribulose-bisphosphate carboxylase large chain